MASNLAKSAIKGMVWNGISQVSTQVFRFGTTLILAHILFPEDFGLFGMASVFIGITLTFNEMGLTAGLIQKKELKEGQINSSFWVGMAAGLLLCLFSILASPLVADFFNDRRLIDILNLSSLIFIIGGLTLVPKALLFRDLRFKELALIDVAGDIAASIVAVLMAFFGWGYWSLVWRNLIANIVPMIIYWVRSRWRPKLSFDLRGFKELFYFSNNVMVSGIIDYAQTNIDSLIVGKSLGAVSLGYYSLAVQVIGFPVKRISTVIGGVLFPVFSKIQDDDERLRKGYLKTVRFISLVTFPLLAGLFMVAPEFIPIFLGDKWLAALPLLRILCILGAIRSITSLSDSIFLCKGRADIKLKWGVLTFMAIGSSVLLSVGSGVTAVAFSVAVIGSIMYLSMQLSANKLVGFSLADFAKALFPAAASSFIMASMVYLARHFLCALFPGNSIVVLLGASSLGVVVYLVSIRLTDRDIEKEIRSTMSDYKKK
jgi:O-antigen/teichoic acid export membrane protein